MSRTLWNYSSLLGTNRVLDVGAVGYREAMLCLCSILQGPGDQKKAEILEYRGEKKYMCKEGVGRRGNRMRCSRAVKRAHNRIQEYGNKWESDMLGVRRQKDL